jgi:hypothetical protein
MLLDQITETLKQMLAKSIEADNSETRQKTLSDAEASLDRNARS